VWHGFTQMSTFGDNDPIIVERSEGHELTTSTAGRYLDAISSLWVNTLGHCIPELDDAITRQLALGAALDECSATGTVRWSSYRESAGARRSRRRNRTSSTHPTARRPSEQALKIAFQQLDQSRCAAAHVPGVRRRVPRRHDRGPLGG